MYLTKAKHDAQMNNRFFFFEGDEKHKIVRELEDDPCTIISPGHGRPCTACSGDYLIHAR
jgi:hypothetical protein